jgi:hypothetical protein
VLLEDGRVTAKMLENGKIQPEHFPASFKDTQEYWGLVSGAIKIGYKRNLSQSETLAKRNELLENYRNAAEAYHEFCFSQKIPDELLEVVVPSCGEDNLS